MPESIKLLSVYGGPISLMTLLLVCDIPMKNMVYLVLRLALRSYFLSLLTIIHKLMEGDLIPEIPPTIFSLRQSPSLNAM